MLFGVLYVHVSILIGMLMAINSLSDLHFFAVQAWVKQSVDFVSVHTGDGERFSALYAAYCAWAERRGAPQIDVRAFGRQLSGQVVDTGDAFRAVRGRARERWYIGLKLRPTSAASAASADEL